MGKLHIAIYSWFPVSRLLNLWIIVTHFSF
jgi:hypothetical protein